MITPFAGPLQHRGLFPITDQSPHCFGFGILSVKLTYQHVCTGHPPAHPQKHAACNHKKHSLKAQKGTVIICVSHLVLILKMSTLEVNSAMQHDWFKAEQLSRGRN